MKEKIKGFILPTILSVLFALAYFYLAVPAINLRAFGFWFMLILTAAVFIGLYVSFTDETLIKRIKAWLKTSVSDAAQKSKKKKLHRGDYVVGDKVKMNKGIKIALIVLAAILVLVLFVTFFTSTRLFRASKYQQMLTVTESDFAEDIKELPISQIPIVDRDTAERLGSRKIGEVVELVSQFNVASYYSQINYKNNTEHISDIPIKRLTACKIREATEGEREERNKCDDTEKYPKSFSSLNMMLIEFEQCIKRIFGCISYFHIQNSFFIYDVIIPQ